jgi:alanyl-tRNA synthetase
MPVRKLSGSDVRSMFLRYFEQHGHKIVRSSSLAPANDPTLLFTNAGMNQFKDVFLGIEKRDYARATSAQKCVRAGGKHNDLENVGFTNRHHTFFEMLGNFSFGDYFKKDAIAFAWDLVTSPEWFGIEKDKLFVTIFKGADIPGRDIPRDDDAEKFWIETGVTKERIFALGMKDNFWQMGDTGPCGPCSEIHYDMGPAASESGHTDCTFPCDCGRYVELWNLVFMQYNFEAGVRSEGVLGSEFRLLPKPSIDTGAGLERVTAVMQGVISNYDTDLFVPLIKHAAELTGASLETELRKEDEEERHHQAASLRVIADHARAATFLISDGVLPSNEGRGYVLRKIIRRAIRHGRLLGQGKPFLYEMVFAVHDLMRDAYPELVESANRVAETIKGEETRFAHTLDVGYKAFENVEYAALYNQIQDFFIEGRGRLQNIRKYDLNAQGKSVSGLDHDRIYREFHYTSEQSADVRGENFTLDELFRIAALITGAYGVKFKIPGDQAFRLYDTFGLPLDFMTDAARDRGIGFDQAGFDAAMDEQRKRAQASWKGGAKSSANPEFLKFARTEFEGYRLTYLEGSIVRGIYIPGGPLTRALEPGQEGEIILDRTPFYAESGGQVGDVGWFFDGEGNTIIADVLGCYMPVQGVRFHKVRARARIQVSDLVNPRVNDEVRRATMRNHTGTHLLHAALREVLGKHVKQAGSLVDPAHLRFDFSHFASLDDEELQDIEDLANREVLRNDRVEVIEDVPIDVAVNEYHAMALFGEKYGDRVRVIRIGDFSTELCGGTHTSATGEIGLIKILKEGSVSSGVRRLEAVTGEGSLRHFRKDHQLENVVSTLVRGDDDQSPADALKQELERREEELKKLRKELDQVRMKSASTSVQSAAENMREVKGVKVLATRADNLERAQLRVLIDNLRNKLGSGVVVLGSVSDGKVALIVGVTKDLTSRVQAGKVIAEVAKKVGGSGGGRPDMAEAGGKDPAALDAALAESYNVVERLLQ